MQAKSLLSHHVEKIGDPDFDEEEETDKGFDTDSDPEKPKMKIVVHQRQKR